MILTIGGSGFVGSFLLKELQERKVENLDKNPSPFFDNITTNGDIRNLDEIKIPKGTKSVVLLAAEHRDDVSPTSLYYDVNVQGTKNVLQAMDNAGVKNIIFTSSVAIYGLNKTILMKIILKIHLIIMVKVNGKRNSNKRMVRK